MGRSTPGRMSLATTLMLCASVAFAQDGNYRRPGGLESTPARQQERAQVIAQLQPCDVLGVWAHPDDETFAAGTFAKLSANGKRVQLIYTTSGDAGGDKSGRGLSGSELATEREQEMRQGVAAMQLPTEPVFLRYPDGRVYDYWDEVIGHVQSIIRQTKPQVVVTFGPDGYYGHADHVAIGQITGRAFDESESPSHLLHAALSRSTNDIIVQASGSSQFKPVADRFVTYKVNIRDHIEQKIGAMQAHKTQFDPQTVGQYRLLITLTGTEDFVEVRHPGESGQLSALFAD